MRRCRPEHRCRPTREFRHTTPAYGLIADEFEPRSGIPMRLAGTASLRRATTVSTGGCLSCRRRPGREASSPCRLLERCRHGLLPVGTADGPSLVRDPERSAHLVGVRVAHEGVRLAGRRVTRNVIALVPPTLVATLTPGPRSRKLWSLAWSWTTSRNDPAFAGLVTSRIVSSGPTLPRIVGVAAIAGDAARISPEQAIRATTIFIDGSFLWLRVSTATGVTRVDLTVAARGSLPQCAIGRRTGSDHACTRGRRSGFAARDSPHQWVVAVRTDLGAEEYLDEARRAPEPVLVGSLTSASVSRSTGSLKSTAAPARPATVHTPARQRRADERGEQVDPDGV